MLANSSHSGRQMRLLICAEWSARFCGWLGSSEPLRLAPAALPKRAANRSRSLWAAFVLTRIYGMNPSTRTLSRADRVVVPTERPARQVRSCKTTRPRLRRGCKSAAWREKSGTYRHDTKSTVHGDSPSSLGATRRDVCTRRNEDGRALGVRCRCRARKPGASALRLIGGGYRSGRRRTNHGTVWQSC